jgi:hypothetical protein
MYLKTQMFHLNHSYLKNLRFLNYQTVPKNH